MNFQDTVTPPHRSTGLDPDAADDLIGDDMAGSDDGGALDGSLDDGGLSTPRPDGLDDGLGTDNATGSNATV